MVAVPDRLEQSIGEPQNENVLDRFLSEVVIDAIELVLVEDIEEVVIELARRREIRAERLLDDDSTPGAVFLARETRSSKLAGDRPERRRRGRHVEQAIALGATLGLDPLQGLPQPIVARGIVDIAAHIGGATDDTLGELFFHRPGGELLQRFAQVLAERVIRHFGAPDADQSKCVRQQATRRKIVKRWNEQPVHEVPGGAEHHQAAWIGLLELARRPVAGHALSPLRLESCALASMCYPERRPLPPKIISARGPASIAAPKKN